MSGSHDRVADPAARRLRDDEIVTLQGLSR
jgi:hypothetical protein